MNAKPPTPGEEPTGAAHVGGGRRAAKSPRKHPTSVGNGIRAPSQIPGSGGFYDEGSTQDSTSSDSDSGRDEEARWRTKLRGYDSIKRLKEQYYPPDPRPGHIRRKIPDEQPEPRPPHMWGKPRDEDKRKVDPTEEHQEYDSILESEGFSMVSVSSLPSAQQNSGSQSAMHSSNYGQVSSGEVSVQQAQDRAQTGSAAKAQTPAVAPSPSMPPPPMPSAHARSSPQPLTKPTDGTPRLTRIVRAGIALQGVLSPKTSSIDGSSLATGPTALSQPGSSKSPKQRMDELFSGFGPGTRRELRAGLRLGEELAKRQNVSQGNASTEDDLFSRAASPRYPELPNSADGQSYRLKVPTAEDKVEYPALKKQQLPSPEDSLADDEDKMSWKATSPAQNDPILPTSQPESVQESVEQQRTNRSIDPKEAQWQREREAVSKQIEEANTSQVIVIDGDSEIPLDEEDEEDQEAPEEEQYLPDEEILESEDSLEGQEEDDFDIWQPEAQSSKLSNKSPPDTIGALFQNEAPKPKRSKLPMTWRRHSQVVYSDELEPEQSESFLRPTEDAAKVIHKGEVAQQQIYEGFSPLLARQASESDTDASASEHEMSDIEQPSPEQPSPVATKDIRKLSIRKTERLLFSKTQLQSHTSGSSRRTMIDNKASIPSMAIPTMTTKQNSHLPPNTKGNTPPGLPPAYLYSGLYLPPSPPRAAPTSWLTRLFSTTTTTTSTTALRSSPNDDLMADIPGPLYTHLPLTLTHHLLFLALFLTQLENPNIYSFSPYSPYARYLSQPVSGQGWVHYTSKADIALIDKFLSILDRKGVRRPGWLGGWGSGDKEKITGRKIMSLIFQWWRNGVLHGDYPIGEGNKTGFIHNTERLWTEADIVARDTEDDTVPNPAIVVAQEAWENGLHWAESAWIGKRRK